MLFLSAHAAEAPPIALVRPFEGEHATAQFFSHRGPRDEEARSPLTAWGASLADRPKPSRHRAYDWRMPVGTPLRAAIDGTVVLAGLRPAFTCPMARQGEVTDQLAVVIRHVAPDGSAWLVGYDHLSVVGVAEGATVAAGAPVGQSGNTGCSSGPHLHFSVKREREGDSLDPERGALVDPYGWSGDGEDPWATARAGEVSVWLWAPGEAPLLFREERIRRPKTPGIVAVRGIVGPPGAPGDEFVDVRVGAGRRGVLLDADRHRWRIPKDATPVDGQLRVVSGPGADADGVIHAGLAGDWWDDAGDCVTLRVGGRVVDTRPVNRGRCRGGPSPDDADD